MLDSVNQHPYVLTHLENLAGLITALYRVGVDLDLTIHEIDDPVVWDAAAGIGKPLFTAVATESALGNLDNERDVGRLGQPVAIVVP